MPRLRRTSGVTGRGIRRFGSDVGPLTPSLKSAPAMFIHVATDFLPRGEAEEAARSDSRYPGPLLDRLRAHAVASTALGGLVVVADWAVLALFIGSYPHPGFAGATSMDVRDL